MRRSEKNYSSSRVPIGRYTLCYGCDRRQLRKVAQLISPPLPINSWADTLTSRTLTSTAGDPTDPRHMSLLKDLRLLLRFGKSLPSRNTLRIEDHIRRGARDGSFGDNSKEVARDIAGLVRSLAVRKELLDIWTGESESQSTRVTKSAHAVGLELPEEVNYEEEREELNVWLSNPNNESYNCAVSPRSTIIVSQNSKPGRSFDHSLSPELIVAVSRKTMQGRMSCLAYSSPGDPFKVLDVKSDPSLSDPLKNGQARVKMLYSPICSYDHRAIESPKREKKDTESVIAGREGVGEVVAVGEGDVLGLVPGDRVVAAPGSNPSGTWANFNCFAADRLIKISSDIPLQYASSISGSPVAALRMIREFHTLQKGDMVIHSMANCGGNATTGFAVLQIAKDMGLHTITVLEERPEDDLTAQCVLSLGGDMVVYDTYLHTKDFYATTQDIPQPKLALDCLGGRVGTDMIRSLGKGGAYVQYGGSAPKYPSSIIKKNSIKKHQFNASEPLAGLNSSEIQSAIEKLTQLVREEKLIMFFEEHAFSIPGEAIEKSYEPYTFRHVVMDMSA